MKNNFFFTAIIFFQLMGGGHAVHATTICEGIAGNAGAFMGILTKLPTLTAEDFDRIANSKMPFNLLTEKTKDINLSSARTGIQKIIPQLKKDEWEMIRQLAAQHVSRLQQDNVRTNLAVRATAPLPMQKKLITFSNPFGSGLKTISGTDGHTYFAFRHSRDHIYVHRDGDLIWQSPKPYPRNQFTITEIHPGKIEIEIYTFNVESRKIETESFDVLTGNSNPSLTLDVGDEGSEFDFSTRLSNDKRYFILGQAKYELLLQPDGRSKWLSEQSLTEDFYVDQNGNTLFLSRADETKLYRIIEGKINVAWKTRVVGPVTHSFMSREGRLFFLYGKGGKLREPLDKSRTVLDFSPTTNSEKVASFLQTSDGRIYFAHFRDIEPGKTGFEIFELTDSPRLIHRQFIPNFSPAACLLQETSTGPVFITYNKDSLDYFQVGMDNASHIGNIPLSSWSTIDPEFIAGKRKAFLVLHQDPNSGRTEYNVHQIWGEEKP